MKPSAPFFMAVTSAAAFIVSSLPAPPASAASGDISTVAGTGTRGYSGDGGAATSAQLNFPSGVAIDPTFNLLIADWANHRIRKVDAATGVISTVAGNGTQGYGGDGGPAISAQLDSPIDVAIDPAGNLLIADLMNRRVRKVDAATGIISTVAGNGTVGDSGDGGPATSAQFWRVRAVAVDSAGNLFIAEAGHNRIRMVDATTGIISTVAGGGTGGDGGPATSAQLAGPADITVDSAGNLFISDWANSLIRKVDATTGIISTVAGGGTGGDGGAATSAHISTPDGIAVDPAGNLFIAGWLNHSIRKVDATTGIISTVAGDGTKGYGGDGGPATFAQLNRPFGVAADPAGNLLVADFHDNRIRKVLGVAAPAWGKFYGQANLYYQYFASIGHTDTGLAYWFYFRAYGDQAYCHAIGYPGYARFKFYQGLGYFYYTLYKNSAPNVGSHFLYLYLAYSYAYYDYLNALADPAHAGAYYNFYYALALSVL